MHFLSSNLLREATKRMKLLFELQVAQRYLRLQQSKNKLKFIRLIPLSLLVLALVLYGLDFGLHKWRATHFVYPKEGSDGWGHLFVVLAYGKQGIVGLAILVGIFVELIKRYTLFTAISIYGIFLGTCALLVSFSVVRGFENDLMQKMLGMHAHIQIEPSTERPFFEYKEVVQKAKKVAGVVGSNPYLGGAGVSDIAIASAINKEHANAKGVDPNLVGQVGDLPNNMVWGQVEWLNAETLSAIPAPNAQASASRACKQYVDFGYQKVRLRQEYQKENLLRTTNSLSDRLPGVVLGCLLAEQLGVEVGSQVEIVSMAPSEGPFGIPSPGTKKWYRVVGIFDSGLYEYDRNYLYMALPALQKQMGLEDESSGVEVRTEHPDNLGDMTARIQQALGKDSTGHLYKVTDWKHIHAGFVSGIEFEQKAISLALGLITLVAVFSIISNGLMLVTEKKKEISILKSIGTSNQSIFGIFLLLGLVMGVLGTVLGLGLGFGICVWLNKDGIPFMNDTVYYIRHIEVVASSRTLVSIAIAALALSAAAAVYPAWLASRLRPVEGLR